MGVIMVFGASVAYGSGDTQRGGWVNRLNLIATKAMPPSRDEVLFYNLGIPGNTSSHLQGRFLTEVQARRPINGPTGIILAIGGNDAAFFPGTQDRPVVELKQFESSIHFLLCMASKQASKTLVLGITPVVESVTKWRPNPPIKTKESVGRYNQVLKDQAAQRGAEFLSLDKGFIFSGAASHLMCEDGVHPNSAGHQRIAEQVWQRIQDWEEFF